MKMASVSHMRPLIWLAAPAIMCLLGICAARSGPLPDAGEMRESVVRIMVETDKGITTGTGFIINSHRAIATNNHVVDGAKTIQVAFLAAGKPTLVSARLLAADAARDMAIIETDAEVAASC